MVISSCSVIFVVLNIILRRKLIAELRTRILIYIIPRKERRYSAYFVRKVNIASFGIRGTIINQRNSFFIKNLKKVKATVTNRIFPIIAISLKIYPERDKSRARYNQPGQKTGLR